jgi:hypothetical protein
MKPQELACSVCVSRTMESVGLVLTGRDKVRINEPFAFGQNDTLSKPVGVPHRHCTLGFESDTSAHAPSASGVGRWGGGGELSVTSAHVALKDSGRHRPGGQARVR